MPTCGTEKIATDAIKRASHKWKCLHRVPKAERHCSSSQVGSRRTIIFHPRFIKSRAQQCSVLPWARHISPPTTGTRNFSGKIPHTPCKAVVSWLITARAVGDAWWTLPNRLEQKYRTRSWNHPSALWNEPCWSVLWLTPCSKPRTAPENKEHQWCLEVCPKDWPAEASPFFAPS